MKHKFECGIIGTSHDSAGDSFLLGMKMREESEARMRRLAIDAASAPLLRRELRAAHETIVVLLKMQGGKVFIPDIVYADLNPDPKTNILVWRDEARGGITISYKE